MHDSLGGFLQALDRAGELHRVTEPVSPILEITEIAQRHAAAPAPTPSASARRFDPARAGLGGKALLFESVVGCDFPLAINVYGSYHRTELALRCAGGTGLEGIADRIESLVHVKPPGSIGQALAKGRELMPLLRVGPKRVKRGPCQDVVRLAKDGEVDLTRLPLIKCWPMDGDPAAVGWPLTAERAGTAAGEGRYITFAGMHTIHADDADAAKPASHNIGMYRAQLVGPDRLAMHWHVHHDGAAHWRSWKRRGKPMPIAICFGGETVMPYAATCPLPPGISELLMAGYLNGRGIPLVRAKTVPLWVPANSEFVIEGWVSTECGPIDFDATGEEPLGPGAVLEGPFGDHTGFYSLPDRYPQVEVTAVTHRREPVFPAIVVGLPPQEDYYLGKATERIFRPLLQTLIPDLVDYHLPLFGCFHNCTFVQVRKAYPLQGRRVMHAVWGAGQMAWTKLVVVVDQDVNVHDEDAVLGAIFRNTHFDRDLEIVNGPLDILDHAAPRLGAGHKMGIDATVKWPGEEVNGWPVGEPPAAPATLPDAGALRAQLGDAVTAVEFPAIGRGRLLVLAVDRRAPGRGAAAIERAWTLIDAPAADLVIAVDAGVDVCEVDAVLFHLGAQCDPGRDRIRQGTRVGFDATTKRPGDERGGDPVRPFPPILVMDEDVKAAVDRREDVGV